MNLPKQLARAVLQLIPIGLFLWTAWLFSPFGASRPAPQVEGATRVLGAVMALTAIVLLVLYFQWLRRVVIIYRLQKLVREHGENGLFHFVTPDGTICAVSSHPYSVSVTLGGQLSSLTYVISSDTMLNLHREQEIWLDEVNSEYGPALRWFTVESTSRQAVNERRIVRKIFEIIKDQRHS